MERSYTSGHFPNHNRAEVLLGFGGLTEIEIDNGVQLLKKAWGIKE